MPTKLIMASSALFLMAIGLIATFAPEELLTASASHPQPLTTLLVQATGALYLGFGAMNWMAKEVLIGGIYSRPLAMGNFLHFFVMSGALLKALLAGQRSTPVWITALLYVAFAVLFGEVVFGDPLRAGKTKRDKHSPNVQVD